MNGYVSKQTVEQPWTEEAQQFANFALNVSVLLRQHEEMRRQRSIDTINILQKQQDAGYSSERSKLIDKMLGELTTPQHGALHPLVHTIGSFLGLGPKEEPTAAQPQAISPQVSQQPTATVSTGMSQGSLTNADIEPEVTRISNLSRKEGESLKTYQARQSALTKILEGRISKREQVEAAGPIEEAKEEAKATVKAKHPELETPPSELKTFEMATGIDPKTRGTPEYLRKLEIFRKQEKQSITINQPTSTQLIFDQKGNAWTFNPKTQEI